MGIPHVELVAAQSQLKWDFPHTDLGIAHGHTIVITAWSAGLCMDQKVKLMTCGMHS